MHEDIRAGADDRGRPAAVLGPSADTIYRVIMGPDEAPPELDHGDGTNPPREQGDGDRRPDPDWWLVGFLAFSVSFAAVTTARMGQLLYRVMTS